MIKNKKTIKKNPNPSAHKKMVKTQAVSSVKASETGCENYYDSTNSRLQIRTVLFFTISLLLFSFLIKGENFWTIIHNFLFGIFGVTFILWPILFMYISVCSALKREKFNLKRCFYYGTFSILFTSTFIFVFFTNNYKYENIFENLSFLYKLGIQNRSAGLASGILGIPLLNFLGIVGSKIVTSLAVFVFLILFFNTDINQTITSSVNFIKKLITHPMLKLGLKKIFKLPEPSPKITINTSEQKESIPQNNNNIQVNENSSPKGNINKNSIISKEDAQNQKANVSKDGYEFPPIYLLKSSMQEKNSENISKELKAKGETLIKILESFSVTAKIVNICKGPSVTRYELNPSCGTKISKITNLADDIALNLAALDIRIEAPIPGKSAIGIEIPNNVINLVRMQELINSREFINSKSKLTVVLGRDITGSVKIADLAKMPHLLIAGSTGAGKSVCINSFIISLLYKSSPNEVKLIMIDPKVVELGIYNGIPHLMVPVVTDPRKASNVLNWAVIEMLKRYKLFAEHNVRDLESFNSLTTDPSKNSNIKPLPEIVIIIDELADLMMASPKEVEDSICRLAQMARAAGMHLVIATQRPSVNVITGVIKANIPSRIALAVSSQIDSRTILDSTGAEKLLGKGDMLFSPIGALKPIRVQGCFVTDREIQSVIDYIKNKNENNYNKDLLKEMDRVNDEEEDDYKEKPRNRRTFKK